MRCCCRSSTRLAWPLRVPWGYVLITLVFLYTTVAVVIEKPDGIKIASFFIAAVVVSSIFSRLTRNKELRFRGWMHYPPYSALASVLVRSDRLDDALQWSGTIGKWFEKTRHEGIRVLGPAAAPILRLKRDYRYHFVLKSASREKLNALLRTMLAYGASQKIPRTQVIVDVDALWLM